MFIRTMAELTSTYRISVMKTCIYTCPSLRTLQKLGSAKKEQHFLSIPIPSFRRSRPLFSIPLPPSLLFHDVRCSKLDKASYLLHPFCRSFIPCGSQFAFTMRIDADLAIPHSLVMFNFEYIGTSLSGSHPFSRGSSRRLCRLVR